MPETPRTLLKRSHGAEKVDPTELWPVHVGEIKFTVSALPQQKAGQTDLAACADDEVKIWEPHCVKVVVDRRRRDLLDDCIQIRSMLDLLAHQITDRVRDLLTTAVGDRDRELQGIVIGSGLFSLPKYCYRRRR